MNTNCDHAATGICVHPLHIGGKKPGDAVCARCQYSTAPMPTNAIKSAKCCHKKQALVVVWLGIRWRGVPAPVRWWKARRFEWPEGGWPGCGCIVKLKAIYQAIKLVKNA